MATKKWLLKTRLKEQQIATLKELYPDYEMVTDDAEEEAFREVEWTVGWNDRLTSLLEEGQLPSLRWVQAISAGVNSLPLATFERQGIYLTNASGIHSEPIAEYVIGVLLSHMRGLRTAILNQPQRKWGQTKELQELKGKTMMIVGAGQIGSRLGELAKAFGMKVIAVNRSGKEIPSFDVTVKMDNIGTIIDFADVVVDILPQTDETYRVFDDALFSRMKKGVLFVNVGRGITVDTDSLIKALDNGTVAYAALDVFDEEPLPASNPLWNHEKVLITPHFSGVVEHFRDNLFEVVLGNAKSYKKDGKPNRNLIDFEKKY
nr:NAD(P)-dependent oxidoreductase [uncultured Trichococcus sp.]